MFLPTIEVTENELMNADTMLPHIRRGQWVRIKYVGTIGQYIGFNHFSRTVRIAWYRYGRKLQASNAYLQNSCKCFDKLMPTNPMYTNIQS